MASFDTGIFEYIHARAIVEVNFPVNKNGTAEVNCNQCSFYRDGSHRCSLTGKVSAYPGKYVGDACPLMTDTEFLETVKILLNSEKETENDSEV